MDQRERAEDAMEATRVGLDGRQAHTWQGGPGVIESYDAVAMTCVVQPAIQGRVTDNNGVASFVSLPLLLDVPVIFQRGGGVSFTFPIRQGDECFFSVADRCIDGWWQQGGVQPPLTARMHSLSDAFAFVGPTSQPNVLTDISTTTAQLRSDDASTIIELDPAGQKVNVTAPGGATITADVTIDGTLHVTGAVTFDGTLQVSGTTTAAEIDSSGPITVGGVALTVP